MTYSSALIIAILAVTGVVPANQPVVATANTTIVRITLAQVRTIALKVHSGIIVAEELEAEKGGSGLRHSFDIKESKGTQEVGVDARTCEVLENSRERPIWD